jgi:carboxyl-terminal processing protease
MVKCVGRGKRWLVLLAVAVVSSLVTQMWMAGDGNWLSRLGFGHHDGWLSATGSDLDQDGLNKLVRTYRLIKENYVLPVDDEALLEGAIQGMVESLEDPHST